MATSVVVIGGGVAGLVAASKLRERGIAVTLIEREAGLGGRMRPDVVEVPGSGPTACDPEPVRLGRPQNASEGSGAPVDCPPLSIHANEPGLAPIRPRLLAVAQLAPEGQALQPTAPWVTLAGGTRELIDRVRRPGWDEDLELLTQHEVTALVPDGRKWRVQARECGPTQYGEPLTRTIRADAVVLTQPVPEVLSLLEASRVPVPDPLGDDLKSVKYARALSIAAAFSGPTQLAPGTGVAFAESPLALLFANRVHGAPTAAALTGVVDPDWASAHWADTDEEVVRAMQVLFAPWATGLIAARVRRRLYARALTPLTVPFVEVPDVPPLVLASSGLAGYVSDPLDAAYTSAVHGATRLCRRLTHEARLDARPVRRTSRPVTVEACVSSSADARAALAAGAERLLLSAAPEVGGITATEDALKLVRRAVARHRPGAKVTVLVRPRVGGFGYSEEEFQLMRWQARRLLRAGADGIAFGCLQERGGTVRVAPDRCRLLVELAHAHGGTAAFNRAFDCLTDRRVGLQDLLALGFDRVYSSGGRKLALDGTAALAEMVGYAGWSLDVVAAGGISAGLVGAVLRATGCDQVLVGASHRACDPTANTRLVNGEYRTTDAADLKKIVADLRWPGPDDETEHQTDEYDAATHESVPG